MKWWYLFNRVHRRHWLILIAPRQFRRLVAFGSVRVFVCSVRLFAVCVVLSCVCNCLAVCMPVTRPGCSQAALREATQSSRRCIGQRMRSAYIVVADARTDGARQFAGTIWPLAGEGCSNGTRSPAVQRGQTKRAAIACVSACYLIGTRRPPCRIQSITQNGLGPASVHTSMNVCVCARHLVGGPAHIYNERTHACTRAGEQASTHARTHSEQAVKT